MTKPIRKYRNIKSEYQGQKFDSKAELKRYLELWALLEIGEIVELRRQPRFELVKKIELDGRTKPAIRYVADFEYLTKSGQRIIEDVKGMITPVYRMKRHLMKAVLGLEIKEIKK